jgi:hypothetical protein
MSKQGMANDAKALSSVPQPPLLLRTVVCVSAVIAITQEGKEWQMMPRHHHPHHCRIHVAAMIAIAQEGEERPKMLRHCCPHSRRSKLHFLIGATAIVAIM